MRSLSHIHANICELATLTHWHLAIGSMQKKLSVSTYFLQRRLRCRAGTLLG